MSIRVLHLLVLLNLLALSCAQAGVGRVVSQKDAVEADSIKIILEQNKANGLAIVEGCKVCPLSLKITRDSAFFNKVQVLPREKIRRLSGRAGTAIYDGETKTLIRVRW